MAKKTISFVEPGANSCNRISINLDGRGGIVSVRGNIDISVEDSPNSRFAHGGSVSLDVDDMNPAQRSAVGVVTTALIAKFKSDTGGWE